MLSRAPNSEKVKMAPSLELSGVEYYDEILQARWYWQDVARGLAKWHLSAVEALQSSRYWKSKKGRIFWTEWNIVMKICRHCQMSFVDYSRLCRGSNSEKKKHSNKTTTIIKKQTNKNKQKQDKTKQNKNTKKKKKKKTTTETGPCRGSNSEKVSQSLEPFGIVHDSKKVDRQKSWRLTCCIPYNHTCQSLVSSWSCLSPDSSRKMPTTLKPFGIFW